ncbi:paeninodin family lasso peptide [Oceanobacillus piezotolerans]|uniref:Paeninodin family lasso peptide n=1 Tax=Oceanobacillus piezotolerans TaxID=2448030 RepID=A0A498D6J8_9BACI|nr:paeninodin family lasso peptide [Oceanobacillus piezotolerans]RLL42774.1 paeninodin family lasso peptide [Oceanobacillus piezotolerans]
MKRTWNRPKLEILDVSMTMNGPGNANADCFDVSDGKHETHNGRSNASCRVKGIISAS